VRLYVLGQRRSEKIFATEQEAVAFAWDKFYEKIDKGYTEKVLKNS
jgi:hypothetical protein